MATEFDTATAVTRNDDGSYAGAIAPDWGINGNANGGYVIALAARHRLPAIYEWREQVADGGLMTYSTSLGWTYERIAWFVDRILKGARPADLAVERPSKFELVINQRTAHALGLSIPQSVLVRTDEVLE